MSDGFAARKAALSLIRAAAERGEMLSDDGLGALAPPDRARALSLAREAMRWAGSADRATRQRRWGADRMRAEPTETASSAT